jgi:hypothetical protein
MVSNIYQAVNDFTRTIRGFSLVFAEAVPEEKRHEFWDFPPSCKPDASCRQPSGPRASERRSGDRDRLGCSAFFQPKEINIVSTAAMHTARPSRVINCRATSREARQLYP